MLVLNTPGEAAKKLADYESEQASRPNAYLYSAQESNAEDLKITKIIKSQASDRAESTRPCLWRA